MITRNFTLYLNAGHAVPLVINVNQYDVGEQWVFSLINGNGVKYTPSTGAIVGIKSDGLGIINSGSVNADGDVVINETQQMTAAVGKNVYELLIDDQTHGTANFIVLVEPKPGDQADFSESDLSLLQQAIDGTSATAIAQGVADWMDDNLTPTTPVVDSSLTVSGAAADAKKTGDEISDLKSAISDIEEQIEGGTGSGLTDDIKQSLLTMFQHTAYKDDDPTARTYYNALYNALYPPIVVTNITLNTNSLSFGTLNSTQQLTATTTPTGGAVTWSSSNTSVATVSATGLVTAIGYGNATITATSGSVSATCSVTVAQATVTSISANYTQSGTVLDSASLDDLKSDLVVTANWSNGTTSTVASSDYTLSGTLTAGTSTVTASYGGQTATFNVTVTENPNITYNFEIVDGENIPRTGGAIGQSSGYSRTKIISTKGASKIYVPSPTAGITNAVWGTFASDSSTETSTCAQISEASKMNLWSANGAYFAVSSDRADLTDDWASGIYGTKEDAVFGWTSGVAYDTFEIVAQSYLKSPGYPAYDASWCRTKCIDCHGASSIQFAPFNDTAKNSVYNYFYDVNFKKISQFTLTTAGATITVPENAYYFCVSGAQSAVQGFVAGQTIPYGGE